MAENNNFERKLSPEELDQVVGGAIRFYQTGAKCPHDHISAGPLCSNCTHMKNPTSQGRGKRSFECDIYNVIVEIVPGGFTVKSREQAGLPVNPGNGPIQC